MMPRFWAYISQADTAYRALISISVPKAAKDQFVQSQLVGTSLPVMCLQLLLPKHWLSWEACGGGWSQCVKVKLCFHVIQRVVMGNNDLQAKHNAMGGKNWHTAETGWSIVYEKRSQMTKNDYSFYLSAGTYLWLRIKTKAAFSKILFKNTLLIQKANQILL